MISLRKPQSIQNIYFYLVGGNTLAASFIWGINTIFLLDAGLSNFEAFSANAFFTLGQVIFEVPTGIIADTFGRRISYLLGAITLSISTILYLFMWHIQGPFWGWAGSSILLGLGFTFFSGALEAWLVDALESQKFKGSLDSVFAKAQIVSGIAMLTGSFSGGLIAQFTNLGVPYIFRAGILLLNFATAFFLMKDLGFTPTKGKEPLKEMKKIFSSSLKYGFGNPPVRWLMLAAPFITGVNFYVVYALQPFLLKLFGDEKAYGVAGLVAATTAFSWIAGGLLASKVKNLFRKRTTTLLIGIFLTSIILVIAAFLNNFWLTFILIFIWGLIFSILSPIRQAYLNGNIQSAQRATVISFDSLMGSSGGIFIQPTLGKIADNSGYSSSFMAAAIFQAIAFPFTWLAKKENSKADVITKEKE